VARTGARFGVKHIVDVLAGADTDQVRQRGHDQLSTYGLLEETPRKTLTNWVYQLVDLGLLERTDGEYPVLQLNDASWEVMRGRREVKLMQARTTPLRTTRAAAESWEGVDRSLFERLRLVRAGLAQERGVPAFVIFGDAALRDMARKRPTTAAEFRTVHGVGDAKLGQFGAVFTAAIADYCREHDPPAATTPRPT
jgi:ATP-dependent DNA helicase RecQ